MTTKVFEFSNATWRGMSNEERAKSLEGFMVHALAHPGEAVELKWENGGYLRIPFCRDCRAGECPQVDCPSNASPRRPD